MVVLRITMFIINFVGNELMAMLMALQALPRSGVTYLSYRSSVIKANRRINSNSDRRQALVKCLASRHNYASFHSSYSTRLFLLFYFM